MVDMSKPRRNSLDVEAILNDLHLSKVKASILLSCDGRIDVKLGDAPNGYDAEAKVEREQQQLRDTCARARDRHDVRE